jgi:hypothetical protein
MTQEQRQLIERYFAVNDYETTLQHLSILDVLKALDLDSDEDILHCISQHFDNKAIEYGANQ